MDTQIYLVIAVTFVGFVALAFLLLFPVYRFLAREETAEKAWTTDAIARRQARTEPTGDGMTAGPRPAPPGSAPPGSAPPVPRRPDGPPAP